MRDEELWSRIRQGKNAKLPWIMIVFGITSLFIIIVPIKCSLPSFNSGTSTPTTSSAPFVPSSAPAYSPVETDRIYFHGSKVVELTISTDRWSPMVVTPPEAKYYKFSNPYDSHPYFVQFADGKEAKINDGERQDFGIRRGEFRFKATAPSQRIRVSVSHTKPFLPSIKVQVDEEKWTEWIDVPLGYKFEINRPNCWEEFLFWDGRTSKTSANKTLVLTSIPNHVFRLRGTKGEVEIIFEPE